MIPVPNAPTFIDLPLTWIHYQFLSEIIFTLKNIYPRVMPNQSKMSPEHNSAIGLALKN